MNSNTRLLHCPSCVTTDLEPWFPISRELHHLVISKDIKLAHDINEFILKRSGEHEVAQIDTLARYTHTEWEMYP